MLTVNSVHAGYGPVPVLHGVSFSVEKGETLVLMGRNGVGKTTLLKTAAGVIEPSSGTLQLDGVNVSGWKSHQMARHGVAYVPQGRGIFPKLSVEENLLVGLRARRDDVREIPTEVLDMFPILKQRMKQLGGTFSGGQQQILALARALCGAPDLLLLDEPSEGIQPSIVIQISDLLRQFNREMGLTVLVVEQNLELIRRVATRCLVMQKGRISEELSRESLDCDETVFEALSH